MMKKDYKMILLKYLLPLFLFSVFTQWFCNSSSFSNSYPWLSLLEISAVCIVSVYMFLFPQTENEKTGMLFSAFVTIAASAEIYSQGIFLSLRTVVATLFLIRIMYIVFSKKNVAYALVPSTVAAVIDGAFALYVLPFVWVSVLFLQREKLEKNKKEKSGYNVAFFGGLAAVVFAYVLTYFLNRERLDFNFSTEPLFIIVPIIAGALFLIKNKHIWKADKAGAIIACLFMLICSFLSSSCVLTEMSNKSMLFPLGIGVMIAASMKILESKNEKPTVDAVTKMTALAGIFILLVN